MEKILERDFEQALSRVKNILKKGGKEDVRKEKIGVKGKLSYKLFDEEGRIKQEGEDPNLVVTEGDVYICDKLAVTPAFTPIISHTVLGIGWVGAAKTDTWVTTFFAGNSKAMNTGFPQVVSATGSVLRYRSAFAAGEATQDGINEAVLSTAVANADGSKPAGHKILAHGQLAPVVNKGAADTLEVTWEVQFLGA